MSALLISSFFGACSDDNGDDRYSINKYNLELTTSSEDIKLNESAAEATALTLDWTPAADLGTDFLVSYQLEINLVGGSASDTPIKKYVDDIKTISYSNKELQDMLINNWHQLTSTSASLQFTITATYEGPRVVIPETSSVKVKIKTYGATQFKADKLYLAGTAVGDKEIEIQPSANNPKIFVYTGALSAGTLNFPVVYDAENKENSICPTVAKQDISSQPMEATISKKESAGVWVIKNAKDYRISVNMEAQTVSIIPTDEILEIDKLFIGGTAVGSDTEISRTLENNNIFAFRAELSAGTLYLPIEFGGQKTLAIVPAKAGVQTIEDGKTVGFSQVDATSGIIANYWEIKTAGIYRIVVDADNKTVTIYSPATDLQSKEVSWNNTVIGVNPFVSKVEKLWMYGGFSEWKYDDAYTLNQSLANPYIFVYKGDVLPRKQANGAMKFCVSNIASNVYAYGSTLEGGTSSSEKYQTVTSNAPLTIAEGQKANRYAYFCIPENTNYVVVNIKDLTVVFDQKK